MHHDGYVGYDCYLRIAVCTWTSHSVVLIQMHGYSHEHSMLAK
jgi:hypothetical protein